MRKNACLALLSSLTVVVGIASWMARRPSADAVRPAAARSAFGKLPLYFVENRGQAADSVRYLAHRGAFSIAVAADAVRYSWTKPPATGVARVAYSPRDTVSLSLRFLGANPQALPEATDPAPGHVSYFQGNDQSRWIAGLPQYAEILYRDLWPGIDLRLRDRDGSLKYEFRVRAGARLSDIRLSYDSAAPLRLDGSGALLIETAAGVLTDAAPVAWQEDHGRRLPVSSRYALDGPAAYGFAVGSEYRADRDLIVDPGLVWSTFLGGSGDETGMRMVVDASGNSYIVGTTQSPDFPVTAGAFQRTGATSNFPTVFVAKMNPTGTALVFATFLGGSNFNWGRAIAVDAAGNVYITGQTQSSNFPTTGGAFDRTFNIGTCPRCGIDQYDAFVAKLNPTGSQLLYSTYLGGTDFDDALAIAVDSAGSAYVTGETGSPDFPLTAAAFDTTPNGSYDAFVAKLNPTGSALVYSTLLGGTNVDYGARIVADGAGNAYVAGNTSSPDFPVTAGAYDTSQNGGFDGFLLKLNPAGSALVYSTFIGGSGMDSIGDLRIDGAGNAYLGGGTGSTDFPTTPGVVKPVCDTSDGYVSKLNPAGSALVWSTCLGGSASDSVGSIALDSAGNILAAGGSGSTDFPGVAGGVQPFLAGQSDAFVARLTPDATAITYATFLGGANADYAAEVAVAPGGDLILTGRTASPDFPTTPGAFDRVWNGDPTVFWGDAWVARITPGAVPPPPASLSTLTVSPSSVTGGNSANGTVTLTLGAPAGGATVLLSSNNASATVPASVTLAQGATSAGFTISTTSVAANTAVTITAAYNGVSRSASLTLQPVPPPASLQSVTTTPTSVVGGNGATGTVILNNPAPAAGYPVSLSANSTVITIPSSVTVAAGAFSGNFRITTSVVTASTPVTITANDGVQTASAVLTVTPQQTTQTAVLTVTATGRSGERVTSTPAGINVAVGSTGSATFNAGTAITLTISNGRDGSWSGACSSSRAKSCSFTLSANASVSVNVN